MSEFERGIRDARKRHHRLYFFTFCALVFVGVIVTGVLVFSSGTSVRIMPVEAEVTGTIDVDDGYAITVDNVIYGFAGSLSITVRAKGFHELNRQIHAEERGNSLVVTLREIPGKLIASTSPVLTNTRWVLDGEFLTIGETLERELEPGKYALKINNPFFEIKDYDFEIERAEEHEVSFDLSPVDGQLKVSSNPKNARISVNGRSNGQTPVSIDLDGGEHKIVVEKEGYVAVEELIILTNEKAFAQRSYRLKRVSSTLTFSVNPAKGQLLLNGRKIDPAGSYEVSSNVKHTLTYVHEGFQPITRQVTLKENESKLVSINLESDVGEVEIHATPSADIFVDGKKAGEGTVNLSLTAIEHTIELRKSGYRTIEKTVRPSSKHKTLISEALIPELTARKSESPREYKNSAGIELKLFEPGPFVMGAPRHQKGQRANEFEKSVMLKKAFYAGKHEITNAQFMMFRVNHSGPPNQPAVSVTWLDAAAFSNWLSKREGLSPFYQIENRNLIAVNGQADGYRLLSEAEWEWLARKSGKKEQTIFPWGDDDVVPPMAGNIADEAANGITAFYVPNYNDGYARGAPVGQFPAEASGLFDLTGNVREWVHDFYALMPPDGNKIYVDPLGSMSGGAHVTKGASWRSGTRTLLRAAYRDGLVDRKDDVGFRIGRYLYGKESTNAD